MTPDPEDEHMERRHSGHDGGPPEVSETINLDKETLSSQPVSNDDSNGGQLCDKEGIIKEAKGEWEISMRRPKSKRNRTKLKSTIKSAIKLAIKEVR